MKRTSIAVAALAAVVAIPALASSWFDAGGGGTMNMVLHWLNGSSVAVPASPSNPMPVTVGGSAYTLASNVGGAGSTTPVTGIPRGNYTYACTANNWNAATAQLQMLGPDGTTYLNIGTAISANGTLAVVLGANSSARVTVTGTPTGLYCGLS